MRRIPTPFPSDAAVLRCIVVGGSAVSARRPSHAGTRAWLGALGGALRTWRTARNAGLPEAKAALTQIRPAESSRQQDDYLLARRCASLFRAFLRCMAGRDSKYEAGIACLPEALAICAGLRTLGFSTATVVVGMSDWAKWTSSMKTPAHSWVEVGDGEQVTESTEVRTRYTIIDRFPAPA